MTKILELCEKHIKVKDLVARDGKTYCNIFVQRVCKDFGYDGFEAGRSPEQWKKCDAATAQFSANDGFLVIASILGSPHGHVAIVCEGVSLISQKWQARAPSVASVGVKNEFTTANWAFREQPNYFVYEGKQRIS